MVRFFGFAVVACALAACGPSRPAESRPAAEPDASAEAAASQESEAEGQQCSLVAAVAPPPDGVVRVFVMPGGRFCVEARRAESLADVTRLAREHASKAPADAAVVHANATTPRGDVDRAAAAVRAGGIQSVTVSVEGH